ncbi:MAG: hypothetical protein HQL27_03950 [Candidatus Omnitrophica bacterium]|nr:hypothetical protein [Candidatus Omnitrophota bacterium]
MTNQRIEKNIVNDAIIKDLTETIYGLAEGNIFINVKDKKITQIHVTRKNDFKEIWELENGGGI